MTAAKRREGLRAAGTTSGTAEEKQPHSCQEPGNSQVTPATEERGWGSFLTLGMLRPRPWKTCQGWSVSQGLPFCSPRSAWTFQRCTERCRASDTSDQSTQFHQRRWNSSAQTVKADPQPCHPSSVSCMMALPAHCSGQFAPQEMEAGAGSLPSPQFQQKKEHWQQEMQTPHGHIEKITHTYPSQQHHNSPSHRHTELSDHHPLRSTKPSTAVPQNTEQLLPDAETAPVGSPLFGVCRVSFHSPLLS